MKISIRKSASEDKINTEKVKSRVSNNCNDITGSSREGGLVYSRVLNSSGAYVRNHCNVTRRSHARQNNSEMYYMKK